jgi:demethylmenaquinone methyltransferase/2-methoxy-6-polyprenyl-1,4-benzoquinol methylase
MPLPNPEEKEKTVQAMFSSIARRYDLNNTLLSFGMHHRWKRIAVDWAGAEPGERVLDLCAGTADLAILLDQKVGERGRVVALDLNEPMLSVGRRKIADRCAENVSCVVANACSLPFPDSTFHAVTVAFGLRNVTDLKSTLDGILRVLRPGGRLVCLEFSTPVNPVLKGLYHLYSFYWIPWIATLISGDRTGTYRYLPASIRQFPDQESFRRMFFETGFREAAYRNLSGGIVAVHTGTKAVE